MLGFLTIPLGHAQACLPELEPNDAPIDATPFSGMGCVMGMIGAGDQDIFVWVVTEQDLRTRQVVFELEGAPGGLTQAFIMRLAFAEDQVNVISRDDLLTLAALDGAKVTGEAQLWTAGSYFLGVSASGSQGSYVLTARSVEPRNPDLVDSEPNDSSAEAREQTGAFALSGGLQGSPDYHR